VYVRFAALGDSATYGIGDPVLGGWRGWARLLADALGRSYDVSFCNVAASGATATSVLETQLEQAVAHRPDLASLVVGVNDTMRGSWDPVRLRDEVLTCAEALHGVGATLLTARFHDVGALFGLPGVLRRPLRARIEQVNAVHEEVRATYGGLQLDLAGRADVLARDFWLVDRLHPSETGHRALARAYADLLLAEGFCFEPPGLECDGGLPGGWRQDLAWLVAEGGPWMGRRARDLGPWAARLAWEETRHRAGRGTGQRDGAALLP
jgi:lysophospholipase L1-like esterase